MKKILVILMGCVVAALGITSTSVADPTAFEVVKKMDTREDGDTLTTDTLMILINKSNQKRIRNIKNIRKDYGLDTKGIIFFLSPADVRNTAYMSYDFDDEVKEDDSWLYLPALQKVKRIASSDKSGSFMGSDFTYSDINGIQINDWEYTFVKETFILDGVDTWVVQGLPKSKVKDKVIEETGYLKTMMWIRKDNYMLVKGKYWVKQGQKIKYFKAGEIKKTDDIWTAHELTMITTVKGKVEHSSVLKFSNVRYNTPINDATFTTRSMERGL
ncbi:MAG: outer membrane lipoprotein-sorting protein [Proteobacteria bacterium]|nr:outer membrane lipoprotein-sorting protein [Pseudomonadota bacterium]MBU1581916.1 outer membrane lipoprotein-sorting protein [Pseudomonadota bacterium]MBU2456130.1 outer membrane lipoprotein-sorting protein [Pseudomonadota bacterium]MBU2629401.1 outer membrane lipoprotein-sorting protein [Pseudomonadota bacterium]